MRFAPTTPTLVMGDDGTMYTLPQPEVPPPETIYAGTVSSFGANNTTYGFIRLDHTGNEVFVSRDDAPDGYLSPGDRCEFRIVDAGGGVTGAQQWQAVQRRLQFRDASVACFHWESGNASGADRSPHTEHGFVWLHCKHSEAKAARTLAR